MGDGVSAEDRRAPDGAKESLFSSREERLTEAVLRIYRAPVYVERGKPETGVSLELVGAINDAAYLAETDESCRHGFGMLAICVHCGADEADAKKRIGAFKERQEKLVLREEDFDDLR